MAVVPDASSESHTNAIGSISQASFSWTHTPGGTPRGVLVFVVGLVTAADDSTAVTYGGVPMTAVSGGFAVDTATEPMSCKAWFLGASVPTGAQSIVVTRNNNTNELWACATTVTAGADTEVYTAGIVLLQGDGTLAEQSVNDGSPGTDSVRYAGIASGLAAFPPTGTSSFALHNFDTGNQTAAVVQETAAGQGSRAVGFASGTSDDRAAVHLAIREAVVVEQTPRRSMIVPPVGVRESVF